MVTHMEFMEVHGNNEATMFSMKSKSTGSLSAEPLSKFVWGSQKRSFKETIKMKKLRRYLQDVPPKHMVSMGNGTKMPIKNFSKQVQAADIMG